MAKAEGKVGIPFLAHAKAGGEAEAEAGLAKATTTAPLELDPADVNDIISSLKHLLSLADPARSISVASISIAADVRTRQTARQAG
jgi:hypothetical protein